MQKDMATTNKHVKAVIQLRRATEQEWIDVNPILREGEPALSTDKNKLKIGNGSLHWSEIPYMAESGGEGGKDYYAGNGLRLNDTIFSIDTAVVAELEDLPTKLSELENDTGFISDFTETDPIFSASAAANITNENIVSWINKSDFSGSYSDLTDKPTIPVVPTNISDFNNDVGYLTEEVDPTVPSWAKAESKPTYTAAEVGALPDNISIPSKTSDLTNDSGYIARAVNDLANYYTKSQTYTKDEVNAAIDEMFEDFTPNNMIETTWANLRSLRDNSQLVKGAWYRITDYNFITTKLGLMSGNHQFDIVLLAISESMLSESGYACRHAGDHYFEREITEGGIEWLYTLFVDDYAESYGDEPVDHADDIHSTDVFCNHTYDISPVTGDEVPVLFKTDGEEYSIDEPDYDDRFYYEGTYDLDGDEYDMWGKYEYDQDNEKWVFLQQYALTPIVVEDGEFIVSPIPETKIVPVNMNAWELKYCLDNDKELFNWAETDGKGVIYYLKDEFGNEAPYDFKNVLFRRKNITRVSSNDLSIFTQGENSHLGLLSNYGITCGDNNYYYYTFDTPFNAGNDSSLFGDSAYNTIKPYILEGQRLINNIVLGIANNNTIGSNCYDLTLWGTVGENNLTYNCSNLLVVGLSQTIMTYVRSTTFFSLGSTTFGSGCFQNIGSMLTNSEIGDGCNNNSFGTGNMGIKMGNGCSNNTFGTFNYNNTFKSGVANCNLGNYVSYCEFGIAAVDITLPNYVRYCKFEPDIHKIKFTTSGGSTSRYIQYVTVCRGISNLTVAPTRGLAYETIYYKTGRVETAV